jgi:predicted nucleotidyltransferase component of viral defense system
MGKINYKKLYTLQDEILKIVFSFENQFYLTGGTCISRFYQAKRYSDDLDFFANDYNRFGFDVKKIKKIISEKFQLKLVLESRDFIRLLVNNELQVDFVNDRVFYYKDVVILDNGFKIDNIENILANKITAVMGRDSEKDIFDIYLISRFYNIDWKQIIKVAKEKMFFNFEDFILRLKTFPKNYLNNINLIDEKFLDDFDKNFNDLIEKISLQGN